MVDPERRAQIGRRLDQIEGEHDIRVLYACESGSRAWGFPSSDSDYDVRVVYVHPLDWYLSIDLERRDDTIDPPTRDEIDVHGWDLRKTLGLFRSANPTLLDWLQSPIVYREDEEAVLSRLRDRVPYYYTPRSVGQAYRGMARSVAAQNLRDEPISHKSYLYVLRALLAVRWTRGRTEPVPVDFDRLVEATIEQDELRQNIEGLVERKRAGQELDSGPRHPVLHDFIEVELERQDGLDWPDGLSRANVEPLNEFFRAVVG